MIERTTRPRRTKVGVVVSNKMVKTVVVAVDHLRRHRLYGRHVRQTRRFKAHDEDNRCQNGDRVVIEEARPISRDKRWRVREVLQSSYVPEVDIAEPDLGDSDEAAESPPSAETSEDAKS